MSVWAIIKLWLCILPCLHSNACISVPIFQRSLAHTHTHSHPHRVELEWVCVCVWCIRHMEGGLADIEAPLNMSVNQLSWIKSLLAPNYRWVCVKPLNWHCGSIIQRLHQERESHAGSLVAATKKQMVFVIRWWGLIWVSLTLILSRSLSLPLSAWVNFNSQW